VEYKIDSLPGGKLDKPENWKATAKTDEWYEDDWWLQEHPEFLKAMFELYKTSDGKFGLKEFDNDGKPFYDFKKVPTREVFQNYLAYVRLREGAARIQYRQQHPNLDAWMLLTKKVTRLATETGKKRLTGEEKAIQKAEKEAKAYSLKEWIEKR